MRKLQSTLLLATIFARCLAVLPPSSYIIKGSAKPPLGWVKQGDPPQGHVIPLRIGLHQPNFKELETHLLEVSSPGHRRYGHHLSKEEVESLVAPHPQSLDAVTEWLLSHGVALKDLSYSPAKDWVKVAVPVSLAEQMFDTKYNVWMNVESGTRVLRTTQWSLPKHLYDHIDVITPTTMFGQPKTKLSRVYWSSDDHSVGATSAKVAEGPKAGPDCNFQNVTYDCISQLYNFADYVPTHRDNSIAVTGYLEEHPTFKDYQTWFADQRPDISGNATFQPISINDGILSQSESTAGFEASLDIQWAFGIAHPAKATFYSTGGRPPFIPEFNRTDIDNNEPYFEWLEYVLNQKHIPYVISTSYADDEQTVPRDYAKRVCQQFAQLGARGVSLLFASGDGGVGDGQEDPKTHRCFSNDDNHITKFLPLFPASCPYVTAVGATDKFPEVAVTLNVTGFFSGGGFSNYFERPRYQKDYVEKYLDHLPAGTYEGLFNRAGRAIPDLSGHGRELTVFAREMKWQLGGTSASTPIVSGIVALLNDARLRAGKRPLGFLNPLVYSKDAASAFNDIIVGHNSGCGTTGFNCTTGWDPVTGVGTPDFRKLKEFVLRH